MKQTWAAICILALLFAGTLTHSFYIGGFVRELTAELEEAEARAEAGDWDQAEELTRSARDRWEEKRCYLHITLRHSDTDAVYTRFREVHEFLQCREGGEYSAANACLIAELELLAEAEQFTIENIL